MLTSVALVNAEHKTCIVQTGNDEAIELCRMSAASTERTKRAGTYKAYAYTSQGFAME